MSAKVLVLDIETAPIVAHVWGLFDQNVSLNMIKSDWHLLSWAAKWLGDPPSKVMYEDQRHMECMEDDKLLLEGVWRLLDEADVIVTQNGKRFDAKKLNARFVLNGFQPPSSYKHIDTLQLAKKHFGFTSNKLEYMTDKLCVKFKKLKHAEFAGFELWRECLAGNPKAWKEMEKYNKNDVLSLEELYTKLRAWDRTVDFNLYTESATTACSCGSTKLHKNGFFYSSVGKFQRYSCSACGAEVRARENLFSAEKKASLKAATRRS